MMTVTKRKSPLRVVIGIELAALLGLVAVLWVFRPDSVASAFWGGIVFLVPNAYFTLYAFRYSGTESAYAAALSLHRGQRGKIVLVAVGFALALRFVRPLQPAFLFGGYLFLLAVHIAVAAKISEKVGGELK